MVTQPSGLITAVEIDALPTLRTGGASSPGTATRGMPGEFDNYCAAAMSVTTPAWSTWRKYFSGAVRTARSCSGSPSSTSKSA